MFIHAEAIENQILNDDDLSIFVRLGADYRENYYEYEIPLKLTEPGYYDPDSENESVWPEENMLDLDFETLQAFKQRRNQKVNDGELQLISLYTEFIPETGRRLTIVGSPNLSNVRTIMVGIRNRKKENNPLDDDGFPKSVEVWVNELRLAGFNEEGGWATRGRIQANLADFSTLAISGQYSTPGFGSIEKNVNERQKSTDMNYDFSSTTEFGKFFPQKYGVRIPIYFGYSEIMSNPEYDPLNPDIKMTAVLKNLNQKERNEYLKNAQDYQRIKSFNLTNIRINGNSEKKAKTKKDGNDSSNENGGKRVRNTGGNKPTNKPLWHISNWTMSYGLTETFIRNINTEHNLLKIHTGGLAYNYTITPKNVKPFEKVKFLKYKA
jgi:cell surface protein SprA